MHFKRFRECHGAGGYGARSAHGGFGRERGPHRHGGRVGRMFDHGDLRLVILQLIAEKPRHGYELIKAIEERLGGAYAPSPGVVYPTLTLLEDMGFATVAAEAGGKKLYSITPEGSAHLVENQQMVDGLLKRMEEAAAAQGGSKPQLMRAMMNLRLALRLRMSRGSMSEEQLRAVVAAIDAAAVAVERA